MKIQVRNRDYGFLSATPVTIYKFEEEDGRKQIVFCNHANYYTEMYEGERIAPDDTIHLWHEKHEVCDRCNAWRVVGDDGWQDAPLGGAR